MSRAHAGPRCGLSIIIPTLDEAVQIERCLAAVAPFAAAGAEVLVADGGSRDATATLAAAAGATVLHAPRGRARQMNAGAAAARGEVLLFLHADTRLPAQAPTLIAQALAAPPGAARPRGTAGPARQAGENTEAPLPRGAHWGRFDVHIEGRPRMLRVVATLMNFRSRLTGIATGDQALFVRRQAFAAVGGFPDQPLMEDVELSRRLRAQCGRPACLRERVQTSGRRWESRGVWRTILLMWRLRWRYWRGESPHTLAQAYR